MQRVDLEKKGTLPGTMALPASEEFVAGHSGSEKVCADRRCMLGNAIGGVHMGGLSDDDLRDSSMRRMMSIGAQGSRGWMLVEVVGNDETSRATPTPSVR
jgi:hypothetical protein